MTARLLVVGADPGQTTGLCALLYENHLLVRWFVLQTTASSVGGLTRGLLSPSVILAPDSRRSGATECTVHATVLAIERFVVGQRAARSQHAAAGRTTRELVEELRHVGATAGARVVLRSAADVKPWATNGRLRAAGLLSHLTGLPHAADACRHGLFAAVNDCGVPDPLRGVIT
jgi:hypothetical protein